MGLAVSAGVRTPEHPKISAAVSQVPVGMAAYLAVPIGLGRLEPGIGVELNVIYVASNQGGKPLSVLTGAPGLNARLAWTVPVIHDFFLRLEATGAALVSERVADNPLNNNEIFASPRFRAALGLQLGFWFH